MINSLVSILVPCYNVDQYLSQCLNSLLQQTYKNLQIVLIDDGSSDNTWQILTSYSQKDKRIEIYHQENQGVAVTRNHLLEKIRGEYVLFVDSDDWIELDMVEFLLNQAHAEHADIVTCGMVKNDTPIDRTEIKACHWNQDKVVYEFLRHITFNGSLCNKLLKSSLLHNLKFHCGISYGEDALFVWEVLQKTQKVVVTDKQLYHYRMNEDSISHSGWTPQKKGTGHLVWERIVSDTKVCWLQYLNIASIRFALEDMWALYFASKSNYCFDSHISVRQQNLRKNLLNVLLSDLPTVNMKIYAIVASFSYSILKYIQKK